MARSLGLTCRPPAAVLRARRKKRSGVPEGTPPASAGEPEDLVALTNSLATRARDTTGDVLGKPWTKRSRCAATRWLRGSSVAVSPLGASGVSGRTVVQPDGGSRSPSAERDPTEDLGTLGRS